MGYLQQAMGELLKVEEAIADERVGNLETLKARLLGHYAAPKISEYTALVLKSLQIKSSSIREYEKLSGMVVRIIGDMALCDVADQELKAIDAYYAALGKSPKGAHFMLGMLLSKAYNAGTIGKNPYQRFKSAGSRRKPKHVLALNDEAIEKMWGHGCWSRKGLNAGLCTFSCSSALPVPGIRMPAALRRQR
jgi:hypothetical protein